MPPPHPPTPWGLSLRGFTAMHGQINEFIGVVLSYGGGGGNDYGVGLLGCGPGG